LYYQVSSSWSASVATVGLTEGWRLAACLLSIFFSPCSVLLLDWYTGTLTIWHRLLHYTIMSLGVANLIGQFVI
jgi:hypothetical protein